MGKLFFAINLEFKLFRVTVENEYIGSLKFLSTLFDHMFEPHAGEIGTKSDGQKYTKF